MKLNVPIVEQIKDSQHILIAGAGGGQDVLCGLPLYFTLREMGKEVHLANYSFTPVDLAQRICEDSEVLIDDGLIGVKRQGNIPWPYFPEGFLAQWFKDKRTEDITVWMFAKTGAAPLADGYKKLVEHLKIDTIILVDGGVDSLMRGDEAAPGTLVEDSISLTAVSTLDNVKVKILACAGFGTEVEEGVSHHHFLDNVAELSQVGGFFGTCALAPQMEAFQLFEAACRYIWEEKEDPPSHISTRIIPAVKGIFGNQHMYDNATLGQSTSSFSILLSPLMSLYWFFDAHKVIERNLLVEQFKNTRTTQDAFRSYMFLSSGQFKRRARRSLPY